MHIIARHNLSNKSTGKDIAFGRGRTTYGWTRFGEIEAMEEQVEGSGIAGPPQAGICRNRGPLLFCIHPWGENVSEMMPDQPEEGLSAGFHQIPARICSNGIGVVISGFASRSTSILA
jgi:hypothetical protein